MSSKFDIQDYTSGRIYGQRGIQKKPGWIDFCYVSLLRYFCGTRFAGQKPAEKRSFRDGNNS